jgi:hypothetical protein
MGTGAPIRGVRGELPVTHRGACAALDNPSRRFEIDHWVSSALRYSLSVGIKP